MIVKNAATMSQAQSDQSLGRELSTAFRLPLADWPRAIFETNYRFDGGRLSVEDRAVLDVPSRERLLAGSTTTLAGGAQIEVRLLEQDGSDHLVIFVDGKEAPRESALSAKPTRSAWTHAVIALLGSAAGFIAGYLYLVKAQALESPWALKMAYHTAGWHLLLTLTLFPASVWGQRPGIRSVQVVSFIFVCIHVGIAIANGAAPDSLHDGPIAVLNALSGLLFLASVIYGQRAYRDMDPIAALKAGRI